MRPPAVRKSEPPAVVWNGASRITLSLPVATSSDFIILQDGTQICVGFIFITEEEPSHHFQPLAAESLRKLQLKLPPWCNLPRESKFPVSAAKLAINRISQSKATRFLHQINISRSPNIPIAPTTPITPVFDFFRNFALRSYEKSVIYWKWA